MVKLKNGIEVEDARLDRLKFFDERSRRYPVTAIIPTAKTPRSYTWRCNTHLDQGSEGACVGFGMAHELMARPAEVSGVSNSDALRKIYWEAQKIDPWEGGSYPNAFPQYEGTSVLAGAKVMVKQLKAARSYHWGFSLEDLIMGVGYHGPAVLGVTWYDSMYTPNRNGFISPYGNVVGGHCILCKAVSVKHKRFTLHNSWGKDWGIGGDAYITFDDMWTLLNDDGEVLFFADRTSKVLL